MHDITNFSFKMFKIFRSLRSSVCLKTTVELTFTTQKANSCSSWTACSVFDWKYLFQVNLVQKLKIIILSWHFVPRLIQIWRIPWWCSLFLLSTGNRFLYKFDQKNPKLSVWAENLHMTNLNMQNYVEKIWVFFFCFRPGKTLLRQIWSKKWKLSAKTEIWK